MTTTYFQVDLQVDEFHQKLKFIREWKKKWKYFFSKTKKAKNDTEKYAYRSWSQRIAKNDAIYPGNFKRTPSARFEKIICQPKSKQRGKGQNWSGWLTVSRLCSNYIKKFEVSAYGVCQTEVKKYLYRHCWILLLLLLLLLLSLWRFWLFYCKNGLFQPWIIRVIQVWGWLFLGQVILLILMGMLARHLRKPHRNFDTIVSFESITQESSVLVWNSRLNIYDTYTTKGLCLGQYLEHKPWSQKNIQ